MKKLILFACIVMMGSSVFAQQGPRAPRGPEEFRKEKMSERNPQERMVEFLGLTDVQKTKVGELRMAHLKEATPLMNELDIKEAQLKAAIQSEKQADPIIKEINTIRGTLFTAKVKHQVAVRNVLTEEQRIKFDRMKHRRGGDMGKRGRR